MRKVLNVLNLITACIPLLYFVVYLSLLLWLKSPWSHLVTYFRVERILRILTLNLMAYSIIAIPLTIILLFSRTFILKEKILLSFMTLVILETILFVMMLFNFASIFFDVVG
jgi:hypothetical protein